MRVLKALKPSGFSYYTQPRFSYYNKHAGSEAGEGSFLRKINVKIIPFFVADSLLRTHLSFDAVMLAG